MNKNEIVIFETEDKLITLPVAVDHETVWLNRNQMAELFDRDVKTIGRSSGSRKICDHHSTWCYRRKNANTYDRIL